MRSFTTLFREIWFGALRSQLITVTAFKKVAISVLILGEYIPQQIWIAADVMMTNNGGLLRSSLTHLCKLAQEFFGHLKYYCAYVLPSVLSSANFNKVVLRTDRDYPTIDLHQIPGIVIKFMHNFLTLSWFLRLSHNYRSTQLLSTLKI